MSATTGNGKSKFVGFFKGLFGKSEETERGTSSAAANEYPVAERAAAPSSSRTRNGHNGNGSHSSRSEPSNGANTANGGSAGKRAGAVVSIPLHAIIAGLPAELKSKVTQDEVGDLMVSVPLEKVLSQLSQGAVRIPFGDVRQSAPHVFDSNPDSDRLPVLLPLGEIVSQLNPALLVRRTAQKQVEVPANITSPFEGKGKGLVFSVGNAKPVTPAAPRQAAPPPATPARGTISSVPTPTPPTASSPISMPKIVGKATPPPAPTPSAPSAPVTPTMPTIPFTPKSPLTPSALPAARPASQPTPSVAKVTPVPVTPLSPVTPIPLTPPAAAAAPVTPVAPVAPLTPAVPSAPSVDVGFIEVAIKAVAEVWPDGLRQEIVQTNLLDARMALPGDQIEAALKRGRAVFNWKTLRSWIRPALPATVSVHDNAELDLPLKVIAPLFLARKKSLSKPAQKVAIDDGIPNLFFGFPKSDAPPQVVAPATAKASPTSKPVDTNYYIWDDNSDTARLEESDYKPKSSGGTDFVARYATPNEIVSRAAALDGVAGALIALPDGLMVASRIPAELNGDTLAAFLPQIFAKVNQCTKELRMGELNNLNFTVGNVPWKIFRVNAIFFAAFGRVAEPLPTAQLAALASELDRKK